MDSGNERLTFVMIMLVFLLHLSACFWVLLGQNLSVRDKWLSPDVDSMPSDEQYMYSLYFITTTMTSVGYGDSSANNFYEYLVNMFLQLVGVVVFTFIAGSITSVLGSLDSSSAS